MAIRRDQTRDDGRNHGVHVAGTGARPQVEAAPTLQPWRRALRARHRAGAVRGADPERPLVAILERSRPNQTAARGLPPPLEWIIKALDKDPDLRYQRIADLRVDLQRLKAAIECCLTGKLLVYLGRRGGCAARTRPDGRQPGGRLTQRTPWRNAALGAVAIATLAAAMSYYHQARPGADLPLQLPYGAVVTKARDAIAGFCRPKDWIRVPTSRKSLAPTSRMSL